ncbi:MAG: glycosyltransferase family 2 protein [Hyphomonadaceae bacterium]|nr:glycosyltransferase family 2 protein [Hyphomonadaceae bacterium]
MGEAARTPDAATPGEAIDVCVCTFRRPSLRATLASLAAQTRRARMRVIVADNDVEPSAQDRVAAARAELGLDIAYLHAPAQNISVARNACLDAASAPLIAFIDDDEEAPPDWLERLCSALGDADIVFGPVRAIYPPDAPSWMVEGDFHSARPVMRRNVVETGYTSNTLVRASALAALRFDPALGRTGAEDGPFFAALFRQGAKPTFCAEAFVSEPVPPERASLRWRIVRAYVSGQVRSLIWRDEGRSRARMVASAGAKALYCAVATLAALPSSVGWRRNVIRGALHVGVVAKSLGAPTFLRR